ncbi:MAG: hypothetical protein ACRCYY_00235 [Trueperaceae bacterium]
MDRWLVKVTEGQRDALKTDLRDLGTPITTSQGEQYLLFRDSFVALKVAAQLGAKRQSGRTVSDITTQGNYSPLVTFENGDMLVTETL